MTFDDLLGDGKPDPAAVIASPLVQALEHLEHAVAILLVDADAIVGNREHPAAIPADRVETHPRRALRAELQGVADQILKQLVQLRLVGADHRQHAAGYFRPGLLDAAAHALDHLAHDDIGRRRPQRLGLGSDA